MGIGLVWKVVLLQPIMNSLIVLTHWLFDNFGLAIIALTFITRVILYPILIRQMRSTKTMQELQPKLAELQRKYARDRQRLAKEQMAMYRQLGISPAGCLLPMLIQIPIWIALYQSISRVLVVFPEDFLGLSQYLYSWEIVYSKLPLAKGFLWLDLAVPDRFYIMPLLVGGSMWVQQKMMAVDTPDPQQRQQNTTLLWTMPVMFALLTVSFPSGLALYWMVSNVMSIGMQYFVSGWGGLAPLFKRERAAPDKRIVRPLSPAPLEEVPPQDANATKEEGLSHEESGDKRQDRGGSTTKRPGASRRQTRRGKGNRPKKK